MDVIFLIGRILFAAIFIGSGFGHFQKDSIEYARAKGIPSPDALVPLSGVLILVGGLLIATGIFADLGALLVIPFLAPAAFMMHAFWKESDPQMQQNEMAHFMKNLSMTGAAIMLFWLYNQSQDLPLSITEALFGRF
ncbi:MAG: DoxX family protein [Solirubrobacterales bacterium]